MLNKGNDASSAKTDPVTAVTITVIQNGDKYVFALNITLVSGLTASQIFSGTLAYSDRK
jgi:hypothetical protein